MKQAIPKAERCAEPRVSDSSGWHLAQCSRRGTITEEDKLWCFQHAPSAKRQRRAESDAQYKADQDRRMAPSRERDKLLKMLKEVMETLPNHLPPPPYCREDHLCPYCRARIVSKEADHD